MDETLAERVAGAWSRVLPRLEGARNAVLDDGAGDADPLASLHDVPLEDLSACVKRLITKFHLRNNAEQVQIVRINRRRAAEASTDEPRSESIDAALAALKARVVDRAGVLEVLGRIDVEPTLTAHPTEVRRQSIVKHQASIARCLHALDRGELTPDEHQRVNEELAGTIALLGLTDEIRFNRLDPLDEVRNGVRVLAGPIWEALPVLARDLRDAVERHYPSDDSGAVPMTPVRYRSWIGGDRDGNPNVTAGITRATLALMRRTAIERHRETIEALDQRISVSDRAAEVLPELAAWRETAEAELVLPAERVHHLGHEPWRVKLRVMGAMLGRALDDPTAYTAAAFRDDLELVDRALRHAGLATLANTSELFDARVRAAAFGFHLASVDVRQHAGRHAGAVGEMLQLAGVCADYEALDEAAKTGVLERELSHARPLLPRGAALSDDTREVLDTLEVVAKAIAVEPEAIRSYVISMTHEVSDLLAVLVLLKECGLYEPGKGGMLDVVPLFETVHDLDRAPSLMRELFASAAYRPHLKTRGLFQEIMLGYSDSNKDGGYWMANWRLHRAQHELAEVCKEARVAVRFFHGRGGTVARGGGRAGRAIRSTPVAARNGKIRFTEQGEVISFRYANAEIARRHLEQIVNAMVLTTAGTPEHADGGGEETIAGVRPAVAMMDQLADESMRAYRGLIDDPGFWDWYTNASPVLPIGSLNIASRPVVRPGKTLSFENIRAIPWVFGWTQMRANVPGWFGIGSAFERAVLSDGERVESCRRLYEQGGWFAAFVDNAQQEMARARLAIARIYRAPDGERFHTMIAEEFARARRAVLTITGQKRLLDNNAVIQRSIDERNPDTDFLNLLQAELLRRSREESADSATGDEQRDAMRAAILLAVNALAAAMQSTG